MRTLVAGLAGLLLTVTPVGLSAWGMEVHRILTAHAISGLPAELKPFFTERSAFISEHSVDPDLWRVVGLKGDHGEEDNNHFLDLDGLDEPPPFTNVPRNWDAYVKRYGADRAGRNGRLPWRVEEVYRMLVARFRDIPKGQAYAAENAAYLVAALSHYVQDAHMPFHAVTSYDGQATNQRHSFAIRDRVGAAFSPDSQIDAGDDSCRRRHQEFVFDRLAEGVALVDPISPRIGPPPRAASSMTTGSSTRLRKARPVMERRLNEARAMPRASLSPPGSKRPARDAGQTAGNAGASAITARSGTSACRFDDGCASCAGRRRRYRLASKCRWRIRSRRPGRRRAGGRARCTGSGPRWPKPNRRACGAEARRTGSQLRFVARHSAADRRSGGGAAAALAPAHQTHATVRHPDDLDRSAALTELCAPSSRATCRSTCAG
jgi:hypothetical protein